ncbi:MAG: T9SS type A sorting domain-containing protein, partial [Cryomorphaceae bacterium]
PILFSVVYDEAGLFTWDLGDGVGFLTTLSEVSHTYSAAGLFEVSVSTDADVCNTAYTTFLNILPLGTREENAKNDFLIFPNPSKGDLMIVIPEEMRLVEITLYDAVGKQTQVFSQVVSERQVKLKIEDPVAGMYFLLLTNEAGDVFRSRVILE